MSTFYALCRMCSQMICVLEQSISAWFPTQKVHCVDCIGNGSGTSSSLPVRSRALSFVEGNSTGCLLPADPAFCYLTSCKERLWPILLLLDALRR